MSDLRDQLIASEKELRQLEEQHCSEKNPPQRNQLLKAINLQDSKQNRIVAEYLLEHDRKYAEMYMRNIDLFSGTEVIVNLKDMVQASTISYNQYTFAYRGKIDEQGNLQLSDSKKNSGFFRDVFFLGKYPIEYSGHLNGFGKVDLQVSKFGYGILSKKPTKILFEFDEGQVSGTVTNHNFALFRTLTPKMKLKNVLQGESLKEFNQNREIMMAAILNFRENLKAR